MPNIRVWLTIAIAGGAAAAAFAACSTSNPGYQPPASSGSTASSGGASSGAASSGSSTSGSAGASSGGGNASGSSSSGSNCAASYYPKVGGGCGCPGNALPELNGKIVDGGTCVCEYGYNAVCPDKTGAYQCATTVTDPLNCGACGVTCTTGAACLPG